VDSSEIWGKKNGLVVCGWGPRSQSSRINRPPSCTTPAKQATASHARTTLRHVTSNHRPAESWKLRALLKLENKKAIFSYLKEMIWKRIQGSKEKLLSKERKEIFIKAVAQVVFVYVMARFDLRKGFYDHICTIICRY
jgi:hypothetical protein